MWKKIKQVPNHQSMKNTHRMISSWFLSTVKLAWSLQLWPPAIPGSTNKTPLIECIIHYNPSEITSEKTHVHGHSDCRSFDPPGSWFLRFEARLQRLTMTSDAKTNSNWGTTVSPGKCGYLAAWDFSIPVSTRFDFFLDPRPGRIHEMIALRQLRFFAFPPDRGCSSFIDKYCAQQL